MTADLETDLYESAEPRPQDGRITWDTGDSIIFIADIAWMMKEFAWILLIPPIAVPFAAVAVLGTWTGLVIHIHRGIDDVLPEFVACIWVTCNVAWMMDDFLWDGVDEQTPWALTPMFGHKEDVYNTVQGIIAAVLLTGPVIYTLALVICTFRMFREPTLKGQSEVTGLVLSSSIATWCLKDFFWCAGMLMPALVADFATVVLILAASAVSSGKWVTGIDRVDVAWLMWLLSNVLWAILELREHYNIELRYIVSVPALLAATLLAFSFKQVKEKRLRDIQVTEGRQGIALCESRSSHELPGPDLGR